MIHELRSDDTLGVMCVIRPNKAEETVRNNPRTRAWYKLEINLAEDALVGPFDFASNQQIDEIVWEKLKEEAQQRDVDISDLDKVIPLGK